MAVNLFYDHIHSVFNKFVPLKKSSKHKYPCWFSKDIIKIIKTKHFHHKKFKSAHTNERRNYHYEQFKCLRNEVKLKIEISYKHYIASCESTIANDPNSFWKFVKNKRNSNISADTHMYYNDTELSINDDICNAFSEYIESVYEDNNINSNNQVHSLNTLNIPLITVSDIMTSIKKLKFLSVFVLIK